MFFFQRSLCTLTIFGAILISCSYQPAPATASQQTTLNSADLQSDLAVLRQAYQSMHPGLYRYNTKSQMDASFEALKAELNHDQSLEDAYLAFSKFAAKIKCGHTYANFFNQPKSVQRELFQGQNRVPFYFEWLDAQMIVTQDFTPNHQLQRGTKVLAINGTPTGAILARLLTIARADGSNDAKRVASLSVSGDSVYETFDVFFPMFFHQDAAKLKLLVLDPGTSKARTIETEALTYQQRIAPIKSREEGRKGGDQVEFDWKYTPEGWAYLEMPTWALYDSKWDWITWLNAHLDELAEKNPPVFIIDLRGNEGGNDVGNVIISRLVARDLHISALRRLVRYRTAPQDLVPYLDTWDPSFRDWGTAAVDLPQPWPAAPPVPYFKLVRYDDDPGGDVIKPLGKHYAGKVFVLVDSNNSSATFQFAPVIQENKLGLLVGQPTGGNQRGINGGAFFFLRLPKSQIEMDLPLIGTFPLTQKPDAGLTPDIPVTTTIADISGSLDPDMAAVRNAIASAPQ
jgi:hypothetical protein